MEQDQEEPEQGTDPVEVVRVGVDIFLTLLCLYVCWSYAKERPEYEIAARRVKGWWRKMTTAPANLRRAENETVFEAMQVVNDYGRTADDGGS